MNPKNEEKKGEVYEYIKRYMQEYGVCPSTKEIADGIHCAPSTAHKFVIRLQEEGYIEKYGRNQIVLRERVESPEWIPIVGSIACGKPKLAIEDIETYMPISREMVGEGEYIGLIADGDSMIEAGINNRDLVLVRRQETAETGQIVAAIMKDEYTGERIATLKRIYKEKGGRIRLHPENRYMTDILVYRVEIVGVAVKVLKDII